MNKHLLSSLLVTLILASCITMPLTANAFALRNYQTGLCLAVVPKYIYGEAESYPGAPVIVWTCDGTPSQQWGQIFLALTGNVNYNAYFYYSDFTPYIYDPLIADGIPSDFYSTDFYLSNGLAAVAASGLNIASSSVIGVKAAVMKNGTPLIQWGETTDANQRWQAVYVGSTFDNHQCYIFENDGGSIGGEPYVIGVLGGKPGAGQPVVIWQLLLDQYGNPDYFGHPDQYWCVY